MMAFHESFIICDQYDHSGITQSIITSNSSVNDFLADYGTGQPHTLSNASTMPGASTLLPQSLSLNFGQLPLILNLLPPLSFHNL